MDNSTQTTNKRGFTLTELLITVAILAILTLLALNMVGTQRDKAADAKVKSDLSRLKIAFEDYYSDHNCYPPADWFDESADCGKNYLSPYLSSIPCDPKTGSPFVVEYDTTSCRSFKLYATLNNTQDPESMALCDPGGSSYGNYGVSSSNTTITIDCENPITAPSPTASIPPAPSSAPGTYACGYSIESGPSCGIYPNPSAAGCRWSSNIGELCDAFCRIADPYYYCNN